MPKSRESGTGCCVASVGRESLESDQHAGFLKCDTLRLRHIYEARD